MNKKLPFKLKLKMGFLKLFLLFLCLQKSHGSQLNYLKNSLFTDKSSDGVFPDISPSRAIEPFLPLLAPSPLTPFTNHNVPKLSGLCVINFSAAERLYFAKIVIGTPPSNYYVQVDIGSDILWVNCAGCNNCPKKSGLGVKLTLYDPKGSSSGESVTCDQDFCTSMYDGKLPGCKPNLLCQYNVVFGDGRQTTGYFVKDYVQFDRVNGNFGTATANGTVIFGNCFLRGSCICFGGGIGNSVEGDIDANDPGKECVFCLSNVWDTTVLL